MRDGRKNWILEGVDGRKSWRRWGVAKTVRSDTFGKVRVCCHLQLAKEWAHPPRSHFNNQSCVCPGSDVASCWAHEDWSNCTDAGADEIQVKRIRRGAYRGGVSRRRSSEKQKPARMGCCGGSS